MNRKTFVLILAGGAGTRFWPASRESLPKQFLDITGTGSSLLTETVNRFKRFIPIENIFIITHKNYGDQVRYILPELNTNQIILEPTRNNTAASIAYASMKLHNLDPEATCIVSPADHVVKDEKELERVLELAVEHAAQHESITTLSIAPTRPDTGYGYIEYDKQGEGEVRKVKSFKEKPTRHLAQSYIDSGNYAWNTGIFTWTLKSILQAFETHANQIYTILNRGVELYNTEEEAKFVEEQYPYTENISVDYAILERAENVWTIPCDLGWSDLGTWVSLYDQSAKDHLGNVLLAKPVHLDDSSNSLFYSGQNKLLVIKGLDDFLVIDTPDCLLILPKSDEQAIKQLKDKLREQGLNDYL